jgi:hypothetical protein
MAARLHEARWIVVAPLTHFARHGLADDSRDRIDHLAHRAAGSSAEIHLADGLAALLLSCCAFEWRLGERDDFTNCRIVTWSDCIRRASCKLP